MSNYISVYNPKYAGVESDPPEEIEGRKRQAAVEAVLNIFKAQAQGGNFNVSSFSCISEYADEIQKAVEKTDPNKS